MESLKYKISNVYMIVTMVPKQLDIDDFSF